MTTNVQFYDVDSELTTNGDQFAIHRRQDIPSSFLDNLQRQRDASSAPAGDYHKVASVPVSVVEIWMHQGFDIFKERPEAIVARLKAENLTAFLATEKAI